MKQYNYEFIEYDEDKYSTKEGDIISNLGNTNRYRLSLFMQDIEKNWETFFNGQKRFPRTFFSNDDIIKGKKNRIKYRGIPFEFSLCMRLSSCSDMVNEMHISKSGQTWNM